MKLAPLVLALGVAFASPALAALQPGDPAPPFDVQAAQGGKTFDFNLAKALKKGPVVLYFYPKSFPSVCTVEAHEFADAAIDGAAWSKAAIAALAWVVSAVALMRCRSPCSRSAAA